MTPHTHTHAHTCLDVARFFLPLPEGWEHVIGGNIPHPFFVDHINRRTQTLDPRPVPMGWEQVRDTSRVGKPSI